MRPAGGNNRSPKKLNVISTGEVEMMDRAVPLSAEAEMFSPEAMPSGGAPFEEGLESLRTHGHPREMAGGGGVFG